MVTQGKGPVAQAAEEWRPVEPVEVLRGMTAAAGPAEEARLPVELSCTVLWLLGQLQGEGGLPCVSCLLPWWLGKAPCVFGTRGHARASSTLGCQAGD